MQRRIGLMAAIVSLFALVAAGPGCAESERSLCGSSSECEDGKVCREGVCTTPSQASCQEDSDCPPGGYVCIANQCARQTVNDDVGLPDTGPGADDVLTLPDTTTEPDVAPDAGPDTENPRVVAVSPGNNMADVGVDTTIEVTFNKAMNEHSINVLSFKLVDPDGRDVEASSITYDANTNVATFVPAAALHEAAHYRVIVTPGARDASGNNLYANFESVFTTVYNEPSHHRSLAQRYAPVIYQGIRNTDGLGPNTDIPVAVNFDGDWQSANNKTNSRSALANLQATAYYNVVETETHFLVQYVFYYATRFFDAPPTLHEHDMTGIVVVVERSSGEVVLVEGIRVEDGPADTVLSFKPTSSAVSVKNMTHRLDTFPADAMEDATHYPLFIPSGVHAACNWHVTGQMAPRICPHEPGQFPGGASSGVVLRAGAVGQKYADATLNGETGFKEMTYRLLPFVDTFWTQRSDFGRFYELSFVYRPENNPNLDDRPVGPGDKALNLPNRLRTAETTLASFGKAPFAWFKSTNTSGGQWFIDPAYPLTTRFNFGDNNAFGMDYCYNLFFNIDRLEEEACKPE